jgi:hypothetical protein
MRNAYKMLDGGAKGKEHMLQSSGLWQQVLVLWVDTNV